MQSGYDYDYRTAITFLMAGLGIGSLLAMMFAPRSEGRAYYQRKGGSVFGASRQTHEPSNSRVFVAG